MGRLAGMPVAGGAAAMLYPLSPYLVLTLGAETTFFMALTLWGFVALAAGRPAVAGLLLAIATLTRADAALSAVVGGVALLLREPPWKGSPCPSNEARTPTGREEKVPGAGAARDLSRAGARGNQVSPLSSTWRRGRA